MLKKFHPRNKHQASYNFAALIKAIPELKPYVHSHPKAGETIDFSNPMAVKTLNQALLKLHYGIAFWDLPEGYLCPAIPGRAEYIHQVADLLGAKGKSAASNIRVLDIGSGANCVFPLIGQREYGWRFVASEVDATAFRAAKGIVRANKLDKVIDCRLQADKDFIFEGIIKPKEVFDLVICNPPFFASQEEALKASQQKWKKLGKDTKKGQNFGGQATELWCEGGEFVFIEKMIQESADFAEQCLWFTSLVAKKVHLKGLLERIGKKGASSNLIEMTYGQKQSRILAWTFHSKKDQQRWLASL